MKLLKHNLRVCLFLLCGGFCYSIRMDDLRRRMQLNLNSDLRSDVDEDCVRPCNGTTRECRYNFRVTQDVAMSVLCGDCPFKLSDCFLKGCITAGGYVRRAVTVNYQVPGPSIQVCEGDTVIVDVYNTMASESTTIHWHGLRQLGTPFMDGVPFITQCPILPNNQFTYRFKAIPAGTHMWHGHTGFQEADGLFGALVVRRKEPPEIANLYDYDLPEHVITLWHWYAEPTNQKLPIILFKNGTVDGLNLIINGKASGVEFKRGNVTAKTPPEVFYVDQGKRYRFRVITNAAIYCPIQLSVDDHLLRVFASEAGTFEPIEVDSMMTNAGERYDMIFHANQKPGCYKLKVRGMGDCFRKKVRQAALICYNGVEPDLETFQSQNFEYESQPGKLFNPADELSIDWANNQRIPFSSVKRTAFGKLEDPYNGVPDYTFYLKVRMKSYPELPIPGPYPQINDIAFEFPTKNLLQSRSSAATRYGSFCNETDVDRRFCIGRFCGCTYKLKVKRGSLVELVFFDSSGSDRNQDHPFHIHGHSVWVVGARTIGQENLELDTAKTMNENKTLLKNLHNAPLKDTFSVPNKGIIAVRLVADNPGYWIMHCHVSNHMELGMAFLLQVGEENEMEPVPKGFPVCGNWPNDQGSSAANLKQSAATLSLFIHFTVFFHFEYDFLI